MQTIEFDTTDDRAYLRLDRPEKKNALTWEMMIEIAEAIHTADADESVKVIIVTGNGDAFCSGGDLDDLLPRMSAGDLDLRPDDPEQDMMLRHSTVTTPIIAAVNGACVAGGTEFLQVTDIRVAAESATFGLPEVTWGYPPSGGSHTRLVRQIPYAWAMEIILTGRAISAEEAGTFGLVNDVVPDGEAMAVAEEYADTICENSAHAVQSAKEIVLEGLGVPMEHAFYLEEDYGYRAMLEQGPDRSR